VPLGRQVLTIAALTLALTAPMAYGQVEDGVTVDPSSPAGKEYVLPVDQARRDAAEGGKGGRASKGSAPTPAFGVGVRPDRETNRSGESGSSASRNGATASSPARSSPSSTDSGATTTPSSTATITPARRAQERDKIDRALVKASVGGGGASDGSLALLGGGVVVMIVGVAAGLVLRSRAT